MSKKNRDKPMMKIREKTKVDKKVNKKGKMQ
jgi:hypothetical protein